MGAPLVGGERIHRDGAHLEAEEEHDEVVRRDHDRHAGGREEQQRVVLAPVDLELFEVAGGAERGDGAGHGGEGGDDTAEGVEADHAAPERLRLSRSDEVGHRGGEERCERGHIGEVGAGEGGPLEDLEQQHRHARKHEEQRGEEAEEVGARKANHG